MKTINETVIRNLINYSAEDQAIWFRDTDNCSFLSFVRCYRDQELISSWTLSQANRRGKKRALICVWVIQSCLSDSFEWAKKQAEGALVICECTQTSRLSATPLHNHTTLFSNLYSYICLPACPSVPTASFQVFSPHCIALLNIYMCAILPAHQFRH